MRTRKDRRNSALVSSVALLTFASAGAQAQSYIGPSGTGDSGTWETNANWSPATYPDAVGAAAVFNDPPATPRNVTFTAGGPAVTVGSLSISNGTAITQTIGQSASPGTLPLLTFDAAGAGP